MRTKLIFLAGAAIGYVLGTRDGRGRYEQLKSQADSLWHDPRVQEKVSTAGQAVKDKAPEVQAKLADAAGQAASAAKDKVSDAAGQTKDKVAGAAASASSAAKDASAAAKDKMSGEGGKHSDNQIGSEPTSDYTPSETKFNSAE